MSGPHCMQWDSLGMGFAHRGADAFCAISIFLFGGPGPSLSRSKVPTWPLPKIHNTKNGASVNCQVLGEYITSIAKSDDRIQFTNTSIRRHKRKYQASLINWVIFMST